MMKIVKQWIWCMQKIYLKSGHVKVKTEGLGAKKWISYQQVWCDSVNACA